jgi:hypothetical protein
LIVRPPSRCRANKNRRRAAGRGPTGFVRSPRPGRAAAGDEGARIRCAGRDTRQWGAGGVHGGAFSRAAPNNPLRISGGENTAREVEGIRQIRPSPSQISKNGPRSARSTRLDIPHQRASCAGTDGPASGLFCAVSCSNYHRFLGFRIQGLGLVTYSGVRARNLLSVGVRARNLLVVGGRTRYLLSAGVRARNVLQGLGLVT